MRPVAKLKLGYYPLPVDQAPLLRSRLVFPTHAAATVLDPCAGTGAALLALTHGADAVLHAVELDAVRAPASEAAGLRTIHGNLFDVKARVERLSFLYLNPPYDFEIGPLANKRMEQLFLAHTYSWLQPKGVLLLVVPFRALTSLAEVLASRFTRIAVYRMEGSEAERYDQVAVFAVRSHNSDKTINTNHSYLRYRCGQKSNLPVLTALADTQYAVPSGLDPQLTYSGIPLDAVEDMLPGSAAWSYAAPMLLPKPEIAGGRPITPLHGGHVGLLATAGMLNGVFGTGEKRHIARWRPVKHVTETTEVEDGVTTIRQRERFSNELLLVYATGQTLILSETVPAAAPADGGESGSKAPAGQD